MNLSAHYKQIAQGVLSAESGANERQIAGAIPTQPPQTALIRRSEIATFYVCLPVTRYFFGQSFSRADWASARKWNMKQNDVILGVLNFFRLCVHVPVCVCAHATNPARNVHISYDTY